VSRHLKGQLQHFRGLARCAWRIYPNGWTPPIPRQDPFLRGVEAYFRGPAGEVLYARSPRGPLLSGLGSLGPDRQVLELDPVAAMIRLLLLAGAALLVLLPARVPNVPRWLLGLGLLPWALGSFGGPRIFGPFLPLAPLVRPWFAQRRKAGRTPR
jgi:hypothetical protein